MRLIASFDVSDGNSDKVGLNPSLETFNRMKAEEIFISAYGFFAEKTCHM